MVALNADGKEPRGFAAMTPEKQREIASKGGRAAHEKGTAHKWTAEEAREAGRKGATSTNRRKPGSDANQDIAEPDRHLAETTAPSIEQ